MFTDFRLLYVRHNKTEHVSAISDYPIRYNDLTFVLSGSLSYVLDGVEIPVHKGDVLWAQAGTFRARRAQAAGSADYVSFNFLCTDDFSFPPVIENCIADEIPFLLAAIDKVEEKPYQNAQQKSEQILRCLLLSLQSRLSERTEHPLVVRIKRFLHANIKQKITLSAVSKATFFSASYCEEVFRRETGCSIIEYLLKERVRRAKRLLSNGELSLPEIAAEVGFEDYNYFSRTFQKRVGVSPAKYRAVQRHK